MENHGVTDPPYERQENTLSSRMCGAAALCMVYRSFGINCSQAEVWPAIAPPLEQGDSCARTYLLCADALRRGLAAVTLQVRHSVGVLRLAREQNLQVILNHRPSLNSAGGHYSILVGIDEDSVVFHDPSIGPRRRLALGAWLKLWRPGWSNSEVCGNVAVFFGRPSMQVVKCRNCQGTMPLKTVCPGCKRDIPLSPGLLLGCRDASCPERTWNSLFCPWCDARLDCLD